MLSSLLKLYTFLKFTPEIVYLVSAALKIVLLLNWFRGKSLKEKREETNDLLETFELIDELEVIESKKANGVN